MLYDDLTITITAQVSTGYPISIVAQRLGRTSGTLPPLASELAGMLARVADPMTPGSYGNSFRSAGMELFRWLMAEPLGTQVRLAWDRATQTGHGLRLRLSIDPPEIAALPWELLYDPERDHYFATSVATPLLRFLDQASLFGGFAEQEAELPLNVLLVLPSAPDLDLKREKGVIEEAIRPLAGALNLRLLEGQVTRTSLSDALMAAPYHIVHVMGHGAYLSLPALELPALARDVAPRGQSYIQLNAVDGAPDWVDSGSVKRIFANHHSLKLVVLNLCSSGRVDEGSAFRGLAPELVHSGIPAVAAMQYPLSDQAALTFAREFYRQLCTGENAGQVDVAISHARNMLAAVHPGSQSFAAPVLYTHAANGLIYSLPKETAVQAVLDPKSESARLAMFMGSLQSSLEFTEDWAMAEADMLESWRQVLLQAEREYCAHLNDPREAARQAARHGLTLAQARLAALDSARATATR